MGEAFDPEDATSLARCIEGDEDAWRAFISRHQVFVTAVVRRVLERRGLRHDQQSLEEAVADLFGDLCLRRREVLGSYRGQGPFRAWLAVLVANHTRRKAEGLLREREKVAQYLDSAREDSTVEGTPGFPTDPAEEVEKALIRCLPQERLLFQLLYVDGVSVERAAAVLGVSSEAIYLRKHRFHLKIREFLNETKDREHPRDLKRDPGSLPST